MEHDMGRREALKCMAWAGTGALWALNAGVASSSIIDAPAAATGAAFTFLQISDSHVGFDKAANPDTRITLRSVEVARSRACPMIVRSERPARSIRATASSSMSRNWR